MSFSFFKFRSHVQPNAGRDVSAGNLAVAVAVARILGGEGMAARPPDQRQVILVDVSVCVHITGQRRNSIAAQYDGLIRIVTADSEDSGTLHQHPRVCISPARLRDYRRSR